MMKYIVTMVLKAIAFLTGFYVLANFIWFLIAVCDTTAVYENPPKYFRPLLIYYVQHPYMLTIAILVVTILFFILRKISAYKSRSKLIFEEKLDAPLSKNWENANGLAIAKDGELKIAQTGIYPVLTNRGSNWENYVFSFDANIINHCLGIVVRAKSLEEGFMLQINSTEIIPHYFRPINVPSRFTSPLQLLTGSIIWEIEPNSNLSHTKQVKNKWVHYEIRVHGSTVSLYMDDELIYDRNLSINSTGKVGFRNYGQELALVKNIKVWEF